MSDPNPAASGSKTERFAYTGRTSEYFRIWIISLCLTILTLGIYSAWAKVRKRRYLYRSTRLAGASFDYHADPVAILKGRLLAVAMLALYVASGYFAPGLEGVLGLALFAIVPWLIVRARMFNARNTSYRNLRFRFDPAYGEAYTVIVGWSLLAALTLGLLYPHAHYRRSAMIVNHSHFGNLDFRLADISRKFYARYIQVSLALLLIFVVLGVLATWVASDSTDGFAIAGVSIGQLAIVGIGLLLAVVPMFLGPAITKLVLDHITVGEHRLRCDWNIPRIVFVIFTNLLAIAVTLGLAIPWATIRLQRYQYDNLAVDVQGNLGSIIATQSEEVSAFGEEIGAAFDIDIGL